MFSPSIPGDIGTYVDNAPHYQLYLVEAIGNKALRFMNRMLLKLGRHHHNEYQQRHPRTSEDKSKSLRGVFKSFEKLVTMIEDGDVEGAVAHWRLHLRNANETWATRGEGERTVDSLHV